MTKKISAHQPDLDVHFLYRQPIQKIWNFDVPSLPGPSEAPGSNPPPGGNHMAITKNNTPGKSMATQLTAVLEEEAPVSRKAQPIQAKSAEDHASMASIKKEAILGILGGSSLQEGQMVVSPELREQMIRDAAYLRAERRGFCDGDPLQDWVEAEAEINRLLN
jgi:hypothetical protein